MTDNLNTSFSNSIKLGGNKPFRVYNLTEYYSIVCYYLKINMFFSIGLITEHIKLSQKKRLELRGKGQLGAEVIVVDERLVLDALQHPAVELGLGGEAQATL